MAVAGRTDFGAFRAVVSGSVQGVGFRYWAQREAERLGIVGYVRNLDSGEVELWAEGSRDALADFRTWLEEGPPGAVVDCVRATTQDPAGRYMAFTIDF
jgi:acylphosphatase